MAGVAASMGKPGGRLIYLELQRLGCALCWFLVCAISMGLVQLHGDHIHAKLVRAGLQLERHPIFDLVFENLPNMDHIPFFNPDTALHSFIVISLFAGIFIWPLVTFIRRVRRFFWLFGMGYLLRMFCLAGTVLPPSNPLCVPQSRTLLERVIAMPALLFGKAHTCTDKIFSGHTLVTSLLLYFWLYTQKEIAIRKKVFVVWRIYPFLHVFYMVASSTTGRNHYLVDIVVSAVVATLLYHCYIWLLMLAKAVGPLTQVREGYAEMPPPWFCRATLWMEGADIRADPVEIESFEQMLEAV